MDFDFKFDDAPINRFLRRMSENMNTQQPGPMQRALKRAAARYLAWIRKRYAAAAKGDGTWKDLSLATKLSRIRARKTLVREFKKRSKVAAGTGRTKRAVQRDVVSGMRFEILRDTGILFNSLSQGRPGNVEQLIPNGIRVGTAIAYGKYHQLGDGVPRREFMVKPEGQIYDDMLKELQRGLEESARESAREARSGN